MKKFIQVLIATVLLGSLTIQAEPFLTWSLTDPDKFENSVPIPGGDLVARTLHCGNNPADQTIPDGSKEFSNLGACADRYETSTVFIMQDAPSREDMAFVVGGVPGNYYCAATVLSTTYTARSGCSDEVNFTVAPEELGFVPLPPLLRLAAE